MALTFGACPVCGDDVPRTIQMAAGLQKEIFHCESHGRMPYGPSSVPLMELYGASPATVPVTLPGQQAQTGLELIA